MASKQISQICPILSLSASQDPDGFLMSPNSDGFWLFRTWIPILNDVVTKFLLKAMSRVVRIPRTQRLKAFFKDSFLEILRLMLKLRQPTTRVTEFLAYRNFRHPWNPVKGRESVPVMCKNLLRSCARLCTWIWRKIDQKEIGNLIKMKSIASGAEWMNESCLFILPLSSLTERTRRAVIVNDEIN